MFAGACGTAGIALDPHIFTFLVQCACKALIQVWWQVYHGCGDILSQAC